ncbi:putative thioredoxin domain protein [Candidatus Cyrtobacter comes]|uniref:Thioredoxin domain protein n=1 Tax=Candidatus Cyrtobacter comes TaxID=675776 RepID=A0ABU5L7X0_9RICK|nr:thioredoxin-like domain-containing protein [Candidatus Cyrtobacter comes]MDZ5762224.1 putative thioredoxin domain protein [Candidatus Cyrtobacter comes]
MSFILASSSFSIEVKSIESLDFSKTVKLEKSKTNLVFLFASWCRACKDSFSKAVKLQQKYLTSKKIAIHLVSLDKKINDLENFCNNFSTYNGSVVFFKDFNGKNVLNELVKNGIGYSGSIPHLTLFEDLKVIVDGNYNIDPIILYLEKIE